MTNKLWTDIQVQGENMHHVVGHLYGPERPKIEAAARFLDNGRPIALIGVASAAYLCMPSETYLNQQGRFASVIYAADAYYSQLAALKNANVVINSRSGETIEIVKLAQALKENQIPFVLITNEPESSAAKLAAHVVWANTHKDELVSINVVTGMMTTTLVLAAAICGQMDALRPELDRLAEGMLDAVARATEMSAAIYGLFADIRPIHLLYRGASKGAAYCGRLVLEEVGRTPGTVIEASEFRQGPNEVIDQRFGAVLFIPRGKQGELNRSLAADIQRSGGRVLLVSEVSAAVSGNPQSEIIFPVRSLPDYLRPVLEVVPVQMLAYERARAQGYEPGTVRYIQKVILSEEGIPNQG